jgi:hypothetical protein
VNFIPLESHLLQQNGKYLDHWNIYGMNPATASQCAI